MTAASLRKTGRLSCAVALLLLPLPAAAWDLSGDLAVEVRHFATDRAGQGSDDPSVAGSLELEWYHDWDEGDQRLAFTPFLRSDDTDSERSHPDIRELYWRRSFSNDHLFQYLFT